MNLRSLFKPAVIVAVVCLCLALLAPNGMSQSPGKSPRFVVNLLDYVAQDYGGAVVDGKIVSQGEYDEQIEFMTTALNTEKELPELASAAEVQQKTTELLELVKNKAAATEVARLAQDIKKDIIQISGMEVAPSTWPSLKHGAELYAQNCVACHGTTGHGDGPAGKGLEPPAANFHDSTMVDKSPFRAFNVIRVGVPGTGMMAFHQLSDKQVWDLAFYVTSLRYQNSAKQNGESKTNINDTAFLKSVAIQSDNEILQGLTGSEEEKTAALADIRLASGDETSPQSALAFAKKSLDDSFTQYRDGKKDEAKTFALKAYLEGVEPVEPRLRANAPESIVPLEEKMSEVRKLIEAGADSALVEKAVAAAKLELEKADQLLSSKVASPWLTFTIVCGILLREGFEAVLILIALLAVARVSNSRRAAHFIHAGWLSALLVGIGAWFSSGWLMELSGAGREALEGVVSLLAVAVLLYLGFWLHSKTEINRWKQFIEGRVKEAIQGGSLFTLAAISFMAVFREAFETVLFLRAVSLDAASGSEFAMLSGVIASLVFIFALSWALVRFSAKVPVRQLFTVSSLMMAVLAVILTGKGIHALQETGTIGITTGILPIRLELLGLYPTAETFGAQIFTLLVVTTLWRLGQRPTMKVSNA